MSKDIAFSSVNTTDMISSIFGNIQPDAPSSAASAASQYAKKNSVSTDIAQRMNDLAEQVYDEINDNESDGKPALRETQKRYADSASRLLQQNMQFIDLSNKLTENVLSQALSQLSEVLTARKKEADALSGALDQASEELSAAMDELENASSLLSDKAAVVNELKLKLAALQDSLYGIDAEDPRYAELSKQIQQTNSELGVAIAEATEAEDVVLLKLDQAQLLLAKHSGLIQTAIEKSSNPDGKLVMNKEMIMDEEEKHQSFLGRMSELMGLLIKIIGETNLIKIKNDQAQNAKKLEDIKNQLLAKSKELLEQMAKAAEAAAKSACISKILGPVIMVVGIVTSMFGGAALMAIGIGMMVFDAVAEKCFGFSLGGLLMEKVFLPLMEAIKKVTDFVIDKMGLDKLIGENASEIFRNIVAVVVTAVVVVAAAYLAKAAGNQLYKQFGAALANTVASTVAATVTRVINNLLKELPKMVTRIISAVKNLATETMKKLDEMIANALKKLAINPATAAGMLNMLAEVAAMVEVINRSTFAVIDGVHTKKAYKAESELHFSEEINEMLKQSVERMADTIKANDDQINSLSEQLHYLMQTSKDTARYMVNRRPA